MIVGIDHLVLLCPDIEAGVATYAALLGRPPGWRARDGEGSASALFQLDSVALELRAPHGEGPMAERLAALLQVHGPGLQTLVLASDDIDADRRRLRLCGLAPDEIAAGSSVDAGTGRTRQWRRMRLGDAQCGGLRTFVLQRSVDDPLVAAPAPADAVQDLDHLVITTGEPERALGHYGARLGFELTLDRADPVRPSRLLVFRTGNSGVEVAAQPAAGGAAGPDRLWGITWRTRNIEATHARLSALGCTVSEVRTGIRKGTRVFTVRDGTLGVPTLVVAVDPDVRG